MPEVDDDLLSTKHPYWGIIMKHLLYLTIIVIISLNKIYLIILSIDKIYFGNKKYSYSNLNFIIVKQNLLKKFD